MGTYQLFTDATADLSDSPLAKIPSVKIIPMQVEISGTDSRKPKYIQTVRGVGYKFTIPEE
ncbi:MAG: hypothetical protein Q4C91_23210 [Eubacteriales bacterium]|nr:hypothetical protein [Eubacteriales bacterium]